MANRVIKLLLVAVTWLTLDLGSLMYRNYGVEGVDLMFHLYAGREDCFFEVMEQNKTMYIDYTVIGTGMGDSDINFQLTDPQGRPVVTEFRKSYSRHDVEVPDGGQYRFCFDNTYSHFTPKQVAFTLTVTSTDAADWKEFEGMYPEAVYDLQVIEIKDKMDKVRTSLNEIEAIQEQHRISELRDRSIAEHNFERVNFWSTIFLVFSVSIGVVQVVLLKGLFDPHYDVRNYVKKLVR